MAMMVLSARSRVEDKVLALQSGADDFVAKPFSMLEVMARVQALLAASFAARSRNTSTVGDLTQRIGRNTALNAAAGRLI